MAKKKKQEAEPDPGAGLMVMMVSLNLILLIFFVYLNSMGVDDDRRVKEALGSLAGTFGMLPDGLHLSDGEELLVPGAPLVPADFSSLSVVQKIERVIAATTTNGEAFVVKEGDDLIIYLADKVLFPPGQARLFPEAKLLLSQVSEVLLRHPFPIRVEGYSDNTPISTAKYPSNWELSTSRATAVLQYFHDEKHLPIDRMKAVGFGSYKPLVPNDRPKNREKNRRVRIVLLEAAA